MKSKTFFFATIAFAATMFCSCGGNNEEPPTPDNENWYGIKQGTIIYRFEGEDAESEEDYSWALYFDDYGRNERFDFGTGESKISMLYLNDREITILPFSKSYSETMSQKSAAMWYVADYDNYGTLPGVTGYSKTTKTIAGKLVTVWSWTYSGETFSWGTWEHLPFIWKYTDSMLIAASFTASVPEAIFEVPADYVKVE